MDRAIYEAMAAEEDHHWWFTGRRAVLAGLIGRRAAPDADARVLDMGCGSGGNLAMLARFGNLEGVEYDEGAREMAAGRDTAPITGGGLPDGLDVPDDSYGLIGLFDVLEHIEDDLATVTVLGKKLTAGGKLVISVPALPWLWSDHDVTHHHFRRYTRASLRNTITKAGLKVEGCSYFNTLLFPVALAQRMVQRLTGLGKGAAGMPSAPVNAVLRSIYSAERHLVGRIPLPIGLSLWAIASRR